MPRPAASLAVWTVWAPRGRELSSGTVCGTASSVGAPRVAGDSKHKLSNKTHVYDLFFLPNSAAYHVTASVSGSVTTVPAPNPSAQFKVSRKTEDNGDPSGSQTMALA